jgi:hypothetical protein
MNNLYNWHDEKMVDFEMNEINREIGQANLLTEAGTSGQSWLARMANALGGWLIARAEKRSSVEDREFQTTGSKFAS